MDKRTTVGIDLVKDVFGICILDHRGGVVDRKILRRAAFERWAESLVTPCTVAMEACGSAHHWGRFFANRGHTAVCCRSRTPRRGHLRQLRHPCRACPNRRAEPFPLTCRLS